MRSASLVFLEALGFQILAVNWLNKRFEVDIIALDQQVLVFVEVKVRKNEDYGMEHTLISPQKQRRFSQAEKAYIYEKKIKDRYSLILLQLSITN